MPNRHVVKHNQGWAVKAPDAKRASGIRRTQREAIGLAKQIVGNQGGGEVRIHIHRATGSTSGGWLADHRRWFGAEAGTLGYS